MERGDVTRLTDAEHLNVCLDDLPNQLWYLTDDHTYGMVNKAHAAFHGQTSEDLAFKDMYDVLPSETVHLLLERNREAFLSGRTICSEEWIPNLSGEQRLLLITRSPKLGEDGSVDVVVCCAEDITGHGRVEQELRLASDLLDSITTSQSAYIATGEMRATFDHLLESLVRITKSEFGFLDEVLEDPDGSRYKLSLAISDISWDEDSKRLYEQLRARNLEFRNLENLAGLPALTGEPIICNDAEHDPRAGGVPHGHPPIRTFMGLPLYFGNRLVGVAGVANRVGGYDQRMARFLKPFLVACASIIHASRQQAKAEETAAWLRESKTRYRRLYDTMTQGVVYQRRDGRIVSANPAAERILGVSLDEMKGRTSSSPQWRAIDEHGEHLPGDQHPVMVSLRTGEKVRGAVVGVYNPRLEEYRWLEIDSIPLTKPGETAPSLVYAIFEDITEKRHAEEELRRSEAQYRGIFEAVSDALLVVDLNGNIVEANPQACRMYGYSHDELIGLGGEDIVHPDCHHLYEAFKQEAGRGAPFHVESTDVRKDGSTFDVEVTGSGFDFHGKPHLLAAVSDVTQRKRSEAEIHRAQKLESLGTVAGGLAHDFNNLLMAIFGNLELAELSLPVGTPSAFYLKQAHGSIEAARRLTGQLLTFAKGGTPVFDTVDLSALAHDTVEFNLHGSNVLPEFDLPEDLWPVRADQGQIGQVLANLTINGKQAMPEGGKLHIQGRNIDCAEDGGEQGPKGPFVRLAVRDEGTGIPDEILARIFDPYFSTKEAGHGLGLAIAYSIMDRHRGKIEVQSTPNVGSTFTIYLPAIPESASGTISDDIQESATPRVKASLHILLMDDEQIVRSVGSGMLQRLGHAVELAAHGDEAILKYLRAQESGNAFDLAIFDLTVPGGKGGREAARELLEIDPGARLIVSSGYASDPIMADFGNHGFIGRLAKPFTLAELEQEIARLSVKDE